MTPKEFLDLVERMRAAQTEYFRTRDRTVLEASKALERAVDKAVKDFKSVKQESLF